MAFGMTKEKLHDRIERDLSLQSPRSEGCGEVLDRLRDVFKQTSHIVVSATPISREQSLALTNLEQGLQYAIAAVVRNQDEVEGEN